MAESAHVSLIGTCPGCRRRCRALHEYAPPHHGGTVSVHDRQVTNPPELRAIAYVRDIRDAGGDDRPLRRAVRAGDAVRIHRGAFMSLEDWRELSRDERHRHQAIAAARAGRSRPTLSHETAAVIWGVPIVEHHPKVVHVLSTPATGTRSEGGYRRHATPHPDVDVCHVDGVSITGIDRTLVDFVATCSFRSAVAALDWALAGQRNDGRGSTRERLLHMADAVDLVKGRRKLIRALDFADPRSGSPGESISRAVMHEYRFPAPELQTEFRDGRGRIGFVDFWWPEFQLIGEFDGRAKYTDDLLLGGRTPADVVVAEKAREDRLRALGPRVTRWEWITVIGERLGMHLVSAGLPRRG